jgi:hypothetical protein
MPLAGCYFNSLFAAYLKWQHRKKRGITKRKQGRLLTDLFVGKRQMDLNVLAVLTGMLSVIQ